MSKGTVDRECKSCRTSVLEGVRDIDFEIDPSKTVEEAMYEERLSICMDCPDLQYGTTCKHSGCIVTYRAYLKSKSCPDPAGAKW
ncbi:DUF6171 family protein [Evansella tamaricis]|uniref:Uncharacterized protein n=1 Tax=Evansella tamaricis TaxID=2069301 RepID=A0ABS6JIR1_9BACI|nr:DUF6171 family protein [Evansella tamaricis]MBU9713569.1 hypothetical protein [Evansella tamaricis]